MKTNFTWCFNCEITWKLLKYRRLGKTEKILNWILRKKREINHIKSQNSKYSHIYHTDAWKTSLLSFINHLLSINNYEPLVNPEYNNLIIMAEFIHIRSQNVPNFPGESAASLVSDCRRLQKRTRNHLFFSSTPIFSSTDKHESVQLGDGRDFGSDSQAQTRWPSSRLCFWETSPFGSKVEGGLRNRTSWVKNIAGLVKHACPRLSERRHLKPFGGVQSVRSDCFSPQTNSQRTCVGRRRLLRTLRNDSQRGPGSYLSRSARRNSHVFAQKYEAIKTNKKRF